MRRQQQRRLLAGAGVAHDDVRALRCALEQFGLKANFAQRGGDELRRCTFVSGRIGRIDLQQLLAQPLRVVGEARQHHGRGDSTLFVLSGSSVWRTFLSGIRRTRSQRTNNNAGLRVAPSLLLRSITAPHASRKRTAMTMKKMFKVLCPMEGKNGHKWWMRLGTGFPNKDDSINIYL